MLNICVKRPDKWKQINMVRRIFDAFETEDDVKVIKPERVEANEV